MYFRRLLRNILVTETISTFNSANCGKGTSIIQSIIYRKYHILVNFDPWEGLFIDGSDQETEGMWLFSNGEPIAQEVQDIMKPGLDNYRGIEHALELQILSTGYRFNDLRSGAGERRGVICEV